MAGKELEEAVASTSELPAEEAISRLRDVVLGAHPNDAESIKAKEQARTWGRGIAHHAGTPSKTRLMTVAELSHCKERCIAVGLTGLARKLVSRDWKPATSMNCPGLSSTCAPCPCRPSRS